MKTRSTGPHTFVRYEGKLGTVAVILVTPGRELKVSAGNLLPVDSQLARRRHVTAVFPDEPAPAPGGAPPPKRGPGPEPERPEPGWPAPQPGEDGGAAPAPPTTGAHAPPAPPPERGGEPAPTTTSSSLGISFGEPSSLPSGVRLVPAPPEVMQGEEVVGPSRLVDEDDGLPRGDQGKLPWREYARGG